MGMKSIIDTIKSIDDNSKKIVFKHFDQKNVNIFHTQSPDIIKKLTKIA
jgi:Cu/Ag efflux protein CusF